MLEVLRAVEDLNQLADVHGVDAPMCDARRLVPMLQVVPAYAGVAPLFSCLGGRGGVGRRAMADVRLDICS